MYYIDYCVDVNVRVGTKIIVVNLPFCLKGFRSLEEAKAYTKKGLEDAVNTQASKIGLKNYVLDSFSGDIIYGKNDKYIDSDEFIGEKF